MSYDIAQSCKSVSVDSSSGVRSAECNQQRAGSDEIDLHETTLDLDDVLHCKCDGNNNTIAYLRWGTGNRCPVFQYTLGGWSVSLDSTGKDYIVSATCSHGVV